MWSLGWQETLFIFLLALVIFGPKKLPELGKNIAKGLAEFRRHSSDLKATFDREMANIEKETGSIKQDLHTYTNEVTNYDSSYENSYYDSGYNDEYNPSTSDPKKQETSTVSASATQGAESSTQPAQISSGHAPVEAAKAAESHAAGSPEAKAETAGNGVHPDQGKPVARS